MSRVSVTDMVARLEEIGLTLPLHAPAPRGAYLVIRVDDDLVSTSALGPFRLDGKHGFTHMGQIGTDLAVSEARAAAAVVAANLIGAVHGSVGVGSVVRLVHLNVHLWTDPGFEEHASVADGASQTLATAFGPEIGGHSRTVTGAATLPFGLPVVASLQARIGRPDR